MISGINDQRSVYVCEDTTVRTEQYTSCVKVAKLPLPLRRMQLKQEVHEIKCS